MDENYWKFRFISNQEAILSPIRYGEGSRDVLKQRYPIDFQIFYRTTFAVLFSDAISASLSTNPRIPLALSLETRRLEKT